MFGPLLTKCFEKNKTSVGDWKQKKPKICILSFLYFDVRTERRELSHLAALDSKFISLGIRQTHNYTIIIFTTF